jgi:CDP-diacylglycerol--inositol 3-phosphatidyltransferase
MNKVYFYIPNLIGYVRLLLLPLAFFSENPLQIAALLTLCSLLDCVDGKAARMLDQSSLFGSRLDLIADLGCHLLMAYIAFFSFASLWIKWVILFTALNDLCQYVLILSVFYWKERRFDHKKELSRHGFLLPIYYSKTGLAVSNVLNDAFLVLSIFMPPFLSSHILYLCFAGFLFRHACVLEQTFRIFALGNVELSE